MLHYKIINVKDRINFKCLRDNAKFLSDYVKHFIKKFEFFNKEIVNILKLLNILKCNYNAK